ncbi:hypothetical protein [[Limnothrix rosea] IAM M-220]|uniref:hypothetical protein n=1 Tax=[Limnothrix rosea] IAM M-220 TaxID=454133 RepID=UPI000966CD50|nr:hypothetical protein [[Limnothrix rosea] IAM M-220]OKH18107.1 hypothetical protein NIES208_07125 [[Limnothrix rosea] IAM M-220]
MPWIQYVSHALKMTAVAIAPLLLTPWVVTANPLENMAGETYQGFASSAFEPIQVGLPKGMEQQGGWLIDSIKEEAPLVLAIYRYGEMYIVSLEQILEQQRHSHDGIVINEQTRKILDSVTFAEEGRWLSECQINGEKDTDVIGISAPYDGDFDFDVEWFTEFQGLWRVDRDTQRLEPLSPENIRCYNIGFGYDG